MGLIFCLSSYPEPTEVPSLPCFDKAVHVVEYGILASLVYLALRNMKVSSRYLLAVAFTIAFMYGVSDEIHQYFVPSRDADVLDVVADGIGALCFLFPLRYYHHLFKERKRRPGNGRLRRLETRQKS